MELENISTDSDWGNEAAKTNRNNQKIVGELQKQSLKADKSVVDALMNGIIKQPAVDTYNIGSNSLSSVYGLTSSSNGTNGKIKQNGWDVLVRNDKTKKGKSNRYNWNGTIWVDMETGVYDEDVVTKEEFTTNPIGASGKHNGSDSFFIIPENKICIKKTGFRVMSRQGITYRVNMTNSDGQIGTDKIFGWDNNITTSGQYLVLDTTLFINDQAWIDSVGLMKIIGDFDLSEDHIVLASWYDTVLDEHIGIIGNAVINTDYNEKVSVIPYFNNKFAFYFNDTVNTPSTASGECSLSVGSFILVYRGVAYKVRVVDENNNPTTIDMVNTFGTEGSENRFLTSFELDVSSILLDMSEAKDAEGYRVINITSENFDNYFIVSNSLSSTLQNRQSSGIFRKNDNLVLLSMYRREPIGGVLLPYYSRYNIVNFRDKQYFAMSEMSTLTGVGMRLSGNVFTVQYFMFYEVDFSTRKTNYYQIFSDEPIVITLQEGDTVVIDTSLLYRNGKTKISLDTGSEPIAGTTPALKIVRYGEYNNTQLPIVQKRSARVYEHPAFTHILLRGQMELMGKMLFIPSYPDAFSYEENKLLFRLNQALFIYADSPYKSGTNYMRINIDVDTITLSDFDTLVIDTSKITWNSDSSTINYLSEVTKVVSARNYLNTDIPIVHYRRGGMNFYPLFASFFAAQNQGTNLYSINKADFLPYYFSVQETKYNGWKKRLNLLHISDIHIGSEDADINLREAIKLAKEPNIGLSAIIGTGDLTVGYQGAVAKQNTLLQLKMCSEIVNGSPVIPLMQLGNHDPNDADRVQATAVTKAEQWNNTFSPIADKWTNIVWGDAENYRHYHYYDIAHDLGNVRVIMLDQLDHDLPTDANGQLVYSCQEDAVFSQKQIDWLCNEALRVPDGYGVILCNHFGFMATADSSNPTLLNDGQFVQGWRLVPDIVQAWQNKTTLNKNYTDIRSNTQPIKVNVDFSAIGANTEFITYLCGHTHFRTHQPVNGYKQLLIMEDSSGQRGTAFSKFVRVKKSPTSNAFSILSIDRSEKHIYRTSYGAYKNYDETTGNRIEVINYKI